MFDVVICWLSDSFDGEWWRVFDWLQFSSVGLKFSACKQVTVGEPVMSCAYQLVSPPGF